MKSKFSNILIYGLGLMGASLSLALKKKGISAHVTGVVSSSKSKAKGESLKSADAIFTSEEFHSSKNWKDYDFIIFGVPVDLTAGLISELPTNFSGMITDLGSTKKDIIHAVETCFPSGYNYVSSHPMCGSEESGLEFANASLYEGRLCILTSPKNVKPEIKNRLENFWRFVGAETIEISAEEHDSILSYLSHSPHILSSIMADWAANQKTVKRYTDLSPIPLNGGGFRDMTRIAGSNPKMWAAIFGSNQNEIYKSLLDYRDRLDIILEKLNPKNVIDPKEWERFMETSRRSRDYILKSQDDSKNVKLKSGEITVPGDKSLSHRSVLFAALCKGKSKVTGFLEAEDPLNTMSAFTKLGLKVRKVKPGEYEFESPGKRGLISPNVDLDFGNAGTGIRLSAGLLCGLPGVNAVLTGDGSLKKRPMGRIIKPLTAMGASILGLGEKETAPLKVEGKKLKSFRYESPIASAQIKSCLMLAAIASETDLEYSENILSRDHTENMFRFLGNKIEQISPFHFKIEPPYVLNGGEFKVPGDISSAAFFLVLGVLAKEGNLLVRNIGLNPARIGILKALELMGAKIEIRNQRMECGEPVGDLKTYPSILNKTNIPKSLIPSIIDEIPILSVAGLFAKGGFEIRHAEELRAKESDRIHTMVSNFRALGIEVEEYPDGYTFDGTSPQSLEIWKFLASGKKISILSHMDHRIAMSFLIFKTLSGFNLHIDETSWIETSFPGFEKLLESCLYE